MNKTKPGLLVKENGRYNLYEAKRYADDDNWITAEKKTGDEVIFEPYETTDKKGVLLYYINCIGNEEYCSEHGYF